MMDTEGTLNITEDPETLWTRIATTILGSFSSKA